MYKNEYEKSMESYKKLMDEYSAIVNSESYREVCDTMPFDFLNANQKVEALKLFVHIGEKSRFHFKRAEDAMSLLHGFADLLKSKDSLLEGASLVVSAEKKANEINELVNSNPYLPSNLILPENTYIGDIAKECIKVLPTYEKLLKNTEFKKTFIENCITDLSISGLQKLVNVKMILKNEVKLLNIGASNEYKEKMNALREMFGLEKLYCEKFDCNLVGTSFKNEDGSDRQTLLAELQGIDQNSVNLETQKCKYQKAPGVEKDSVAVVWDSETIGFLPQGTVDAMNEKYKDPEYDASLKEVVGGGDARYGCKVEVGVAAKELAATKEAEVEETK